MESLIGNAVIAQSGGPTPVINASLIGAVREAVKHRNLINNFYGSRNAVEGLVRGDLVDLFAQDEDTLGRVLITPGAALGSSRKKIGEKPGNIKPGELLQALREHNARYFFYIGGNDSADNAKTLAELSQREGYEMRVFHIPKTIDNDLRNNDHTPGYGSAARFVACATLGDYYDNRSLNGIKINVIMGRSAGFLTGASALARREDVSAPHLIYLPEIPFSEEKYLADIKELLKTRKDIVISVAEGIEDAKGDPIGWDGITRDGHGNPELDSGYLADKLQRIIKNGGIERRVRTSNFGSIQRCFPECVSQIDLQESRYVGAEAVKQALYGEKQSGTVAIKRDSLTKHYRFYTEVLELEDVERHARKMPSEFIAKSGNDVTPAFIEYAMPLVGELPITGSLR